MDRCANRLISKTLLTTFLIPSFIIVFVGFTGSSPKEAFKYAVSTLFHFPNAVFSWIILGIINILILSHMKPIILFWKNYNDNKNSSGKERDRAMCAFNSLGKVITVLSLIGFTIGTTCSVFLAQGVDFKFLSASYVVTEGAVVGVFTSVLINMSLNNTLFPIKRALMLDPPNIKPRYISFYKQLFMAILLLLAFLGFQILAIAIELYSMAVSKALELADMNSDMKNYYLPEFFFSHAGKSHKATKELLDVFKIKIFIFSLISLRTLILVKKSFNNPLTTVESSLEGLSSLDNRDQQPITIVNNDEFSTIYTDINKLIEKQQDEIKLGQQRLHKIIDHAADPIISFNSEGVIYIFNPAAEEFFKWNREDIQGLSVVKLFDSEGTLCNRYKDDIYKLIEQVTNEDSRLQRYEGVTSNGKKLSFEGNFSKIVTPDGTIYTGILRDISKQIEFETSLKDAKVSAERANRLKSEFLANMSHELRTPLNAVLGFTQLLFGDKNLTEVQQDKIGIISRSGEHLLGLINDILDISKIEAGKIELHDSVFNIREFVNDLKEMFELKCKKKNLALYVEFVDPLPDFVRGDLGKLRQILINIIGNAIKFTSEGGVSLVVGVEENNLKFSVNDTGKGIPENDIESITKPFTQSSLTDNEGGTGLGLAITNSFINMMGGELKIESEIGVGSTFSFSVEVKESDGEETESVDLGVILGIAGDRHPNVLVVDDKENNRLILKEMLERVGFRAMEAENGKVAIKRAKEFRPELIFMDIKMPVMDGYESVKLMKEDPSISNIPTFALTASAFKHDEKSILESGFDGFLAKPFKQSTLFSLIKENSDIDFTYEKQIVTKHTVTMDDLDFELINKRLDRSLLTTIEELALINDFSGIKNSLDTVKGDSTLFEFVSIMYSYIENFDDENLELIIENVKRGKKIGE